MRTACETAINHGFAVNTEEDEKEGEGCPDSNAVSSSTVCVCIE